MSRGKRIEKLHLAIGIAVVDEILDSAPTVDRGDEQREDGFVVVQICIGPRKPRAHRAAIETCVSE